MSNIYCSSCGTKHSIGCKFCTHCGNSLGGFSNITSNINQVKPNTLQTNKTKSIEVDEDGIPTTFVKPRKLAYEIDVNSNNKYSAKDLFNSPPADKDQRLLSSSIKNYKKLSKEEFLSQSLKECSSRPIQDIDET